MDRRTVAAYRRHWRAWIDARGPTASERRRVAALLRDLAPGARVADLGCGPGWYLDLAARRGLRGIGVDVVAAMLSEAAEYAPEAWRVRADLARLPLARESLDAAWALNSLQHVPAADLPLALARVHGALRPGARLGLTLPRLDAVDGAGSVGKRDWISHRFDDDDFPGRLFIACAPERARRWLQDAGFDEVRVRKRGRFWHWIRARRAETLPDYTRPGLDVLICGLNPSPFAAQTGIPFGRPGNRFWPAARGAGLVDVERDPFAAAERGVGFTDLCKRTTRRASELADAEYAAGLAHLEDKLRQLRPRVLCFVGLDGWRRAVDARAGPGWIDGGFGGRPAYLMPSTSGLNAHATPAGLTEHLRRAAAGPRG